MSERATAQFDFEDKEYDENAEVIRDENGLMTITYDNQGYVSHLRIINIKRDIRIDVDRYYNNVVVQVWYKTGDTRLIKVSAEFDFEDGEKPFFEFANEYQDVEEATKHWLLEILGEYLKVPFEEEGEE